MLEEKELIKNELENYLQSKGINTHKNFSCLAGTHEDNNPSMAFYKNNNTVHCFSCGANMDIFDLIGIDYGIEGFKNRLEKAKEITGIDSRGANTITRKTNKDMKNYKDYINKKHESVKDTDYFSKRGISEEIINKFKLGYDDNYNGLRMAIIPTSDSSYNARNIDPKAKEQDRYRKNAGYSTILNAKALKQDRPVFILEGEIDALSVETVGYKAIGLGGAQNIQKLVDKIKELEKVPPIIITLDNDEAGIKASEKLEEKLKELNIQVMNNTPISSKYKDANEILVQDKQGLIKELDYLENNVKDLELKEYLKNSASSYIDEFIDGIGAYANTSYIPTGFSVLDNVLDGGLYEGLYILGAISSLGKTTLALQIADQVARQDTDVLIFSLEMARTELMAKSISRLTYELANEQELNVSNAKTTRGITTYKRYGNYNETEIRLIDSAVNKYSEEAKNIFIYEGLGNIGVEDIKNSVEKHIRITGKRPIVIIDYLQILAPYDIRQTEKQATDKNVMELKRLSRDNKITVLGISSFNRENYKKEVSMTAFKESGAIEYGSDVLIGLQFTGQGDNDFNLDNAKADNPRLIDLKILKNRNGQTGDTVQYRYYPMFNYFEEA